MKFDQTRRDGRSLDAGKNQFLTAARFALSGSIKKRSDSPDVFRRRFDC